jgi:hypothetical protein
VIPIVHAAHGIVSIAHPGRTQIDAALPACATPASMPSRSITRITTRRRSRATPRWRSSWACSSRAGPDFHDPASKLRPGSVTLPWRHWIDWWRGECRSPILQLRDVTQEYGALRPLRIKSLDVRAGQRLAILGMDQGPPKCW